MALPLPSLCSTACRDVFSMTDIIALTIADAAKACGIGRLDHT